jgi:PPOX class probable F420-dependent enzyme
MHRQTVPFKDVEPAMMQRRLLSARIGRLATVTPSGLPHLVPVCFAFDGTQIVTALDRKPKTTTTLRRFDNVRANPVASMLVDHYDEDWSQLWWVRVDGPARVLDEGPELDRGLAALREKFRGQYGLQPPSGPAIVLRAERWVGWSAAG